VLNPLAWKREMTTDAVPVTEGRRPDGLAREESGRPTRVGTLGPPGQTRIATLEATTIRSAMPIVGYLVRTVVRSVDMFWRPLFSVRVYSFARISEPSQPPVVILVFQVPQSWKHACCL